MSDESASTPPSRRRFGCFQIVLIMFVTMIATAAVTAWWVKRYIYADRLEPVALTPTEQETLEDKIALLEAATTEGLDPEKFDGSRRVIELTERELNHLIAKDDPEMAKTVAIDLSDDLVSLNLVVPVEEDAPLVGGKTLRLKVGLNVVYGDSLQPEISIQGVSLGGISLPNAWLGNLKNKNLVERLEGQDKEFWDKLAEGVESVRVADGRIRFELRE